MGVGVSYERGTPIRRGITNFRVHSERMRQPQAQSPSCRRRGGALGFGRVGGEAARSEPSGAFGSRHFASRRRGARASPLERYSERPVFTYLYFSPLYEVDSGGRREVRPMSNVHLSTPTFSTYTMRLTRSHHAPHATGPSPVAIAAQPTFLTRGGLAVAPHATGPCRGHDAAAAGAWMLVSG